MASLSGYLGRHGPHHADHVDSVLTRQPGYRDRIVHVHIAPDEGGMNLTMPPELIGALTLRGQAGGRALVDRFFGDRSAEAEADVGRGAPRPRPVARIVPGD